MAHPRFLADHDLNEQIVRGVLRREPQVEFIRARDVAMDQAADQDMLAYAVKRGLVVISHDVSTMPAAATDRIKAGESMAGLLMVAQTTPVREIIDDLCLIWAASDASEWQDRIEYLPL
jgi:hypothetical protein